MQIHLLQPEPRYDLSISLTIKFFNFNLVLKNYLLGNFDLNLPSQLVRVGIVWLQLQLGLLKESPLPLILKRVESRPVVAEGGDELLPTRGVSVEFTGSSMKLDSKLQCAKRLQSQWFRIYRTCCQDILRRCREQRNQWKTVSCCSRISTHFISQGPLQIVYLYKISNASSEMSSKLLHSRPWGHALLSNLTIIFSFYISCSTFPIHPHSW